MTINVLSYAKADIFITCTVCSKEQQQMDPDELYSSLKVVLQQVRVGWLWC